MEITAIVRPVGRAVLFLSKDAVCGITVELTTIAIFKISINNICFGFI